MHENNQSGAPARHGPDPTDKHPMAGFPQVCFIKNTISNPNIVVGDYSYYDDPEDSERFERNVLYHYPHCGDKLIIGKFCALARGVKFIMNGANHRMSGISTYPFQIFGHGWEAVMPSLSDLPNKGDTVLGNDVWVGTEAVILPGVNIGNGAIIAAYSVVSRDVPAYTIVAGNPARSIRQRFSDREIATLEALAWWDWPIEHISACLKAIVEADVEVLRQQAEKLGIG